MICDGQGMITMQHRIMLRPLGTPKINRLFKENEQYCYYNTVTKQTSCGCGGGTKKFAKYYQVLVEGRIYEIQETEVVESTVEILTADQDFENKRLHVYLQNSEHHDFSKINHNCINCNQLVPHGDYNNNIDTGGRKDPQLTGKA